MSREHPARFKCIDVDISAQLWDESQFSFFEDA
jgi:hypothetical protein